MISHLRRPLRRARKVGFIICGVQKAGTTALYHHLDAHPGICMSCRKEIHFFDQARHINRPTAGYRRYHAYFRPNCPKQVLGEATPSYLYWPGCIRRIHHYNPDLKPIVLLRNPIDRAYSHWNMQRAKGIEPLSFGDAIRAEPERCGLGDDYTDRMFSYVDRGRYAQQLRRLWDYFPRSSVLVMRSRTLRQHPDQALAQVCGFLGVAPLQHVAPMEAHTRSYASPIEDADRDYLRSAYQDEVSELETELGWDCRDWLA